MSDITVILPILFFLFSLVSLAGLVIPIFPGLQLIWAGMCLYWFISAQFLDKPFSWLLFIFVTILMVAGSLVDNYFLITHLREVETPWYSIFVAYIAGLVVGFVFTPFAAILATPGALFLVEFLRLREKNKAIASVRQWLFSMGWTALTRIGIGLVMIGAWSVVTYFQW